ncbi:MAG: hypothetical protein ABIT83_21520 [Massilia sp.]
MIRRILLLTTPLLLAGCINQSANYIYGENTDQALVVRLDQAYFWKDEVDVKLIAARLPDCQRQFLLTRLPQAQLEIGLFSAGDNVFTLRAGGESWRVDMQTCSQVEAAAEKDVGEALGTFKLDAQKKLVFEAAPGRGAPSAAPAEAAEAPAAEPAPAQVASPAAAAPAAS